MNEKTYRRIILVLALLVLILGGFLWVLLGPRRIPTSVSDELGRFKTQLRAAHAREVALGLKLEEISGSLDEAGDSVGSGMVGLEHGQQYNSEILAAIADSQDAERVVEGAMVGIGDFINSVEEFNRQGTSPGDT